MIAALANRRFDFGEYITLSTVASLFMQQKIAQVGVDLFLGYPVVILNALVLLTLNSLYANPKHIFAIAALTVFSLISAHYASTPVSAIIAQILGISLMSVYYFSVLTSFGSSLSGWMELYARFAYGVAVFGILYLPLQRFTHYGEPDRLHSIFIEPSLYVYLTLPAIGWYANIWLRTRRYGWDLLVFALTYVLADSSLGFLGLGLIGAFIATSRLSFWKTLGAGILGLGAFAALMLVSSNFRVRVLDTFFAVSSADVSKSNLSTFAVLSNAYVTFQTFMDHPLLGVGIGGYRFQYEHYIGDLSGIPKNFLDLQVNMFDASSMFLRTLAELGIAGPLIVIGFLVTCARVRGARYLEVRNALLPFFLIRMGRYGAYFSMELFFFVAIYLLNFMEYRRSRQQLASGRPSAAALQSGPAWQG
ncbi:MAG TPA: hypothetical protein VN175_11120 [Rhizomicrobium sp.]|nr:hypothetical protein [Rhizomicrobium sp.]